jgi:hypothetical protein
MRSYLPCSCLTFHCCNGSPLSSSPLSPSPPSPPSSLVLGLPANLCILSQLFGGGRLPVFAGAAHPIIGQHQPCLWPGHGKNGLGDTDLEIECPANTRPAPQEKVAAIALIDMLQANPGEIDVIALGPLTNVALALKLEPRLPLWMKSLWVMGGTHMGRGNTGPMVEFNFAQDPEAAHVVFAMWHQVRHVEKASIPPLHLVSWEMCETSALAWTEFDALCALGSPVASFLKRISATYERFARRAVVTAAAAAAAGTHPQDDRKECDSLPPTMIRAVPTVGAYNPCDAYAMAALLARPADELGLEVRDVPCSIEIGGTVARGALAINWYLRALLFLMCVCVCVCVCVWCYGSTRRFIL